MTPVAELQVLFSQISFHRTQQRRRTPDTDEKTQQVVATKKPIGKHQDLRRFLDIKILRFLHIEDDMCVLFSTCKYLWKEKQNAIDQLPLHLAALPSRSNLFELPKWIQGSIFKVRSTVKTCNVSNHENITTVHIKTLIDSFPNMTEMSLQHCDLEDEHIVELAKCKPLQTLDIGFNKLVIANSLLPLARCEKLTELHLVECEYVELRLQQLACIPHVRVLNLTGTDTTDETIFAIIKKLSKLEELNVSNCTLLTANGVAPILMHPALKLLIVNFCTTTRKTCKIDFKALKASREFQNRTVQTLWLDKQVYQKKKAGE